MNTASTTTPTTTPTAAPATDWRAMARRDGLVAALTALHTASWSGALPLGPTGYAVVPVSVRAAATGVWAGPDAPPRELAGLRTVSVLPCGDGDLVAVAYEPAGAMPDTPPEWSLDLARLRLGLSEALLDATVAHLGDRRAGDVPLLMQQLVKGSLADAVTEQLELRCQLTGPSPADVSPAALADLHRQVTFTDRILLRLLGASGFTLDGPGRTVHASELLADAWSAGRR